MADENVKKAVLAFAVIAVTVLSALYFSGAFSFIGQENDNEKIPLEATKKAISVGEIEKKPILLTSYSCSLENPCSNPPGGMPELGMDCCCSDSGCSENCEYVESGSCG